MAPRGKKMPPPVAVIDSAIHGKGVVATRTIRKNSRIIEYIGEKITKEESERRAWERLKKAKKNGEGAVYIFDLNEEYDLDGDQPDNPARLINHSCEPNCESELNDDRIWIIALKTIREGEELTFDYGYDLDHYEDHPCRCGSPSCAGYIVRSDLRKKLKKRIKASKRK